VVDDVTTYHSIFLQNESVRKHVKRDTFSRLSSPVVDDVTTYHSIFLQNESVRKHVKRDTFSRLSSPVVDDVTTYHSIFLQNEGSQCYVEYLELLLVLLLHHRSYLSPYYTTALLQHLWLPPRYLHVSHLVH
jgi:hypothetical protein